MALYFFHVFDGNEIREVAEAECACSGDLRVHMLESALSFVKQSRDTHAGWSLEVRDDRGVIVGLLEFVDCLHEGAPTIRLF